MTEPSALGIPEGTTQTGAGQTTATTQATQGSTDGSQSALETGQASTEGETTTADTQGEQAGTVEAEAYKDLKLPEGVEVPQENMDKFLEFAKSQKLTKESAQAFLDYQLEMGKQAAEQATEQQAKVEAEQKSQVTSWLHELKQDPNFNTMVTDANRLVDKFADAETAKMLRSTWVGAHPGIVRMLAKAGVLTREDAFGGDTEGAGSGEKTEGERLFGRTNK